MLRGLVQRLTDLRDFRQGNPSDGDALVWNAELELWEPGDVASNGSGGDDTSPATSLVPMATGDPDDPAYVFAPDGAGLFLEIDR